MEDVSADHVGFAVPHQELKAVHSLLNLLLVQHVLNEALVHILCQEETPSEPTHKFHSNFTKEQRGDTSGLDEMLSEVPSNPDHPMIRTAVGIGFSTGLPAATVIPLPGLYP